MKSLYCFLQLGFVMLIAGCEPPQVDQKSTNRENLSLTQSTEYLEIVSYPDYYEVTIRHYRSDKEDIYILYENEKPDRVAVNETLIKIPVKNVVCQGTGHVGYLSYLNKEDLITAVACAPYVYSENVSRHIANGEIQVVGDNNGLNFELLQLLKPSLVLMNSFDDATERMIEQLKGNNVPVIVTTEYFENHPLSKAEWVKLYALLTGYNNIENQFNALVNRYENVKNGAQNQSNKPTVFLGLPWKGEWFVAGGNSFQAQLIADAGGVYLWKDLDSKGAQVIDMEKVIEKCLMADYWMNPGDKVSIEHIIQTDKRFATFSAVKAGQVINNNKRLNKNQLGNDYWESGIMQPDTVLMDLQYLLGNGQQDNYQSKYYQNLTTDE